MIFYEMHHGVINACIKNAVFHKIDEIIRKMFILLNFYCSEVNNTGLLQEPANLRRF